ncbi:MAG TPA: D-glycero-beta-D-manno-heptose 1,7-bisphosphate 7-phosphatase [Gammaproteobacteria bacterium]|nr:D-glycero-beta-D-manno-heptose 1,7-bisphosphate 7-phosphatase [Gammaproteobacteria bacterium]
MKLVILDRDGVINQESDAYIKTPEEWIPIPGSLAAIGRLTKAGFTVVVASNQSGLGRGLFDQKALDAITARMQAETVKAGGRLDGIYYCPHKPEDGCDCRKPKTGLFQQIAAHYGVNMRGIPAIGDSARDLVAAKAAVARPILVKTGRGHETLKQMPDAEVYVDLAAAADHLIGETR